MPWAAALLPFATPLHAACPRPLIRAVDASFIPEIESLGGVFKDNGIPTDPIEILRSKGVNMVRLRVWNNPQAGFCDRDQTLAMARRIHDAGMKTLLDFHYSDSWADPGQQNKPAAWASLSFNDLQDAVRGFSAEVLAALAAQGTLPEIIQIGNEITSGMLWNEGKISYWGDPNWANLSRLLNAGIEGVRQVPGTHNIRIMLHIDRGADNAGSREFFDRAQQYNVPYDMIGLSYYPWWHGSLEAMTANINDLAFRYNKPVLIAETAYPWTLASHDLQNNFVWNTGQLLPWYPATVNGQKQFLIAMFTAVRNVPNQMGAGICYWAPEYGAFPGLLSPWENLALFDFQGDSLDAWAAFASCCPCDLNNDFTVDDSDFAIFANAYNLLLCADASMPPACPSDFNDDWMVDDADFVLFAIAYDAFLCP